MKIFKQWLERQRAKSREQMNEAIRSDFRVIEREGRLWLTHCGVAFRELDPTDSTKEITGYLEKAREVAVNYSNLMFSK